MKIAIIGCGKQAPKHIAGFRANGVEDFVLFDIDTNAAQNLAKNSGAIVVENAAEIFADTTIDAVDICTPVQYHRPFIEKAIAAKKHFFCEKPLTENHEDDKAIERLANAANVIGMVGYIYRFVPALEVGKEIVDTALGSVHTAFFRAGGRGSHMAWKHRKKTGGGALNEMAVHMIDLAFWYFGPMQEVKLINFDLRRNQREINGLVVNCDAEDWLLASLVSKSGVKILLQADLVTSAFTQYVETQGDCGTFVGSIDPQFKSYVHLTKECGSYPVGRTDLEFGKVNFFGSQMGVFLEAIANSKQPERCRLSESVEVMDIHRQLKNQMRNFQEV